MADELWHPSRDGLTPIVESVSKVAEPDVAKLVAWFQSGSHIDAGLSSGLIRVTSKTWFHTGTRTHSSTRREMIRRWLQSNGYQADAQEFDLRLTELISHLQEWESVAKKESQKRKIVWEAKEEADEFLELVFIIGDIGCDKLGHFTVEASDTWNYLRQLNHAIEEKIAKPNLLMKYQEQVDAIGQNLRDLQSRFDASEQPRALTAAQAPPKNQEVIESVERNTPELDTKSIEWLAARQENEEKLGLPIETLRNYRAPSKGGRKMLDNMFGIDRDGRCWRRQGTQKSMVYYFAPTLPKR